jgi:hypothetical protein
MRKSLVAGLVGLFLAGSASVFAAAATPANPYVSVVSATSTNTVVTFTTPAGATLNAFTVFVFNDGPNTAYIDPTAVAVSSDTGAWALNKCEWIKINAPFNAPLTSLNVVTATNQTATVRVEANPAGPLPGATLPYVEHGTQCYSLTNNAVILGVSNIPATSSAPSATVIQGIPASGPNTAGSNVTIQPGPGTGTGAGIQTEIDRNLVTTTGSTAQTQAAGVVVCESKALSTTSATAQTLATIGVASNAAGGASAVVTVVAFDGTNNDVDTNVWNFSFKNKAGTLAATASSAVGDVASSDSGSTTTGVTITTGASLVNVKVTPVFTTIVPTVVTGYVTIYNNSGGAVTCQ